MTTLPHLSAIRVSGADAGSFLHNQLSADVLTLVDGDSVFACYCEPKGRVLALMLVFRGDQDYFVIMSRVLVESVVNRLKIFVLREDVNIEILSEYRVTGICDSEKIKRANGTFVGIPVPGSDTWLCVDEHKPGTVGSSAGLEQWRRNELGSGIVRLQTETSGQFMPQMLGFDRIGAVNFRKGCYTGQEIVARTHYLGKVKRHPRLLYSSGNINVSLMKKIGLENDGKTYRAIVADSTEQIDGETCLMVVARMDPDLTVERIEYEGHWYPVALSG